jgi:hemerythrin-like domain-containing protein
MSIVHNGLIRGVNSVYNQCINVGERGTPKDKLDFANYAAQCAAILHEHHEFEEEVLFPKMNELAGVPGLMDGNVQEHAAFHDGFAIYEQYLEDVKAEKVVLDGAHMKKLIDDYMPALYSHLVNEIDTLIGLEKYDDKVDWVTWFNGEVEKLNKGFMGQSDFRVSVAPAMELSRLL